MPGSEAALVSKWKLKKKKEHLKREFHLGEGGKVSPFLRKSTKASGTTRDHVNLAEQGSHKREVAFHKLRATEGEKTVMPRRLCLDVPHDQRSSPEHFTKIWQLHISYPERALMLENHCAAHRRSYSLSHKRKGRVLTHRHLTIQY